MEQDGDNVEEQPYRTAFHFQPPKNWMNDPNAPMYYNGVYHFFYQYNPNAAVWGNISWGHAVSYNLIDWIHLETALDPTDPYDINGVWSGSATILPDENKPVIFYTGGNIADDQLQNLAMPKDPSDPLLREWVKSPHNPLLIPGGDIGVNLFRDPTTAWRKPDKTWCVTIGSEIGGHGTALLYRSSDFIKWKRADKPLHSSNKTGMWECPDFFPVSINGVEGLDTSVNRVGVKHVLKVSFSGLDYYVIGSYDSMTDEFSVDEFDFMDDRVQLRYDYGIFYASKSFYDEGKQRRVLWAWIPEAESEANDVARGWSGLQSLPRSVVLDGTGKQLIQWPIEEVEKLRDTHFTLKDKELEGGSLFKIEGITGSQADVEVSFRVPNLEGVELIDDEQAINPQSLCIQKNASVEGAFGPFGLLVLASDDLTEQTAIFFRIFKHGAKNVVLMCSDQSRSSLQTTVKEPIFGTFLDVDPNHEISLRTLVDHSMVESFGGKGKSCITSRAYPKVATFENSHIYLFNNGAKSVTISSVDAWSMKKAQIEQVHTRRKPSIS
ncbi:hypothetical protein ACS0TY_022079 [Phlomoides rotata]